MKGKASPYLLIILLGGMMFNSSCKPDEEEPLPVQKWNAEHRNHTDLDYRYKILDMSFYSESVGWAVGDANWSLFRFNGKHWELQSNQTTWAGGLTSVCTVNDTLVFLASEKGGFRDSSGTEWVGMNIQRSKDGGVTWKHVYNQTDPDIRITKFFFVNERVGFGLKGNPDAKPGINTVILRTTDGGETWDNPLVDQGGDDWRFTDVHFWDEEHGILCGVTRTAGLIFTTDDGGSTWTRHHTGSGVFEPLFDLEVTDQRVFASAKDKLYRSDDGGVSWQVISDMSALPYKHDHLFTKFTSNKVGYAFGAGTGPIEDNYCSDLLRTEDGGQTWTRLYLNKQAQAQRGIDKFIAPDDAWIWPNTQDVWVYGHAVDPVNHTGTVIGYFGQLFFFQSWN
ncbi:MAG: hypothetical protein KDC76_13045 [Bacteroidetes bacterium]|nr:hypothetical protein [Bacteroidota bacterium]